jgi:hypothetical protein
LNQPVFNAGFSDASLIGLRTPESKFKIQELEQRDDHRFCAAFCAIFRRFSESSPAAHALPPLRPPKRPNSTANLLCRDIANQLGKLDRVARAFLPTLGHTSIIAWPKQQHTTHSRALNSN